MSASVFGSHEFCVAFKLGVIMKFVIAPDSFKESLSADEAARAIARGIQKALPDAQCICLPMADGGEGTAETLRILKGGKRRSLWASNPLGKRIEVGYALLSPQSAVMEMAEAAGLALLSPAERNPLHTDTWGVGEMLVDILDLGIRNIIIGIGGSATNDGGSGMLAALGVKFFDKEQKPLDLQLQENRGAKVLSRLGSADFSKLDKRLHETQIVIACDVDNILLGENGASAVFAPQKGADNETVKKLETCLSHYAEVMVQSGFADHRQTRGSGAAGGMGFALLGLPRSRLQSGIDLVIAEASLAEACKDADYVISGEGCMDGQTLAGKVPLGVLRCAQAQNVEVIVLCGSLDVSSGENQSGSQNINPHTNANDEGQQEWEKLQALGFKAIFPTITKLDSMENTLRTAAINLERTAYQVASLLK